MNPVSISPRWPDIVVAGVTAGSVDVLAAALINHVGPGIVLQAIASGLLGKSAFAGGARTIAAGMLLQWAMSITIAAIFLIAAAQVPSITRWRIAAGLLYGVGVYVVMTFVVVPLSRARSKPDVSVHGITADLLAMMFVRGHHRDGTHHDRLCANLLAGAALSIHAQRTRRSGSPSVFGWPCRAP